MEKIFAIFVLTVIAICFSENITVSGNNGDKLNVSLIDNETTDDVDQNVVPQTVEILSLFKCHGSNIDEGKSYEIPYHFFLPDSPTNNSTISANFTQKDPECQADLIATSSQMANESENIQHALYTHGWLLKYYDNDMPWESIPTNEFCIQSLDENNVFSVKYCKPDCKKRPCISKCCLANEVCDVDETSSCTACVDSGPIKWTTVANSIHQNITYSFQYHNSIDCEGPDKFNIYTLHKHSINITARLRTEFKILQNGAVVSRRKSDGPWITLTEGTYCVDGAVQSGNSDDVVHFSGHPENMVLYTCRTISSAPATELEKEKYAIRYILYRVLIPFATVFLILTIVVYLLSWSKQNVHGYTAFFYLVTLLALYIFLIISNVPGLASPEKHPKFCAFTAGAIHFFYLSTMCWLTSLSFNVWRTFNKNNMLKRNNSINTSRGLRRFSTYCVFSIGYPTIQVGLCVILDAIYRNTPDVPVVLPNYGLLACNNLSNDGITYYLFTPVSILLGCNSIFFIATIITMKHYKKSIRQAFREVNNSNTKVDISFGVYARMFIIMGIFWMTQIITWFIVVDKTPSQSLEIIIAVTDALTVLQAVVIFYIFVCKRHVFINLWNLQPWLHPFLSLWIKGGCCAIPPADARKPSQTSTLGPRGMSKKESTENRISRDSNMFNPNAVLDEDIERKTSVTSVITVVSDTDVACSGRPKSDDQDAERKKKTSETTV